MEGLETDQETGSHGAGGGRIVNISEGFIHRPIATSLLMLAIAMFGMVAYRSLPVSDLPNVDFPTLLVTAALPGASPETMASAVATPLENQFSMIAGLESMTSVNSLGNTQVTLEFALSRQLDGAAVDVQAAITQASRLLPQGMPTPPTFTKVNPADQPILYLALTSPSAPLWTLDEYAQTRIAQRISMVTGVAQVQVLGAQKYAVHAQMDPQALATRQIGINEVEAALKNWNVNLPTGAIVGPKRAFTLQASGQLMSAAQYRSLVVAYRKGSPVRLEELGKVIDSVEDDKTASWFYNEKGGERAIVLAIQRQPGTNTIEVTDNVKKLLPLFKQELPPSVMMNVLYDRSETIRESFNDVKFTMALTLGLVVMVIFLFLRNVSATVIPSLALPFSIIGTFAIMYLLNYSLDNLSMMALILSIGFVVDDAIVMLENIVRHMEMGEGPMQAALEGSREIGFTIVSMTVSLAAVFIPVLFMGGILGRLFKEFAVTICVAILISGVVSVTLTPMLCSRFLKPPHDQRRGWFYHSTERFFDGMLRLYDRSLQWVLRYRPVTMAIFVVVLVATAWMFIQVPKGFIPAQDTDQMIAVTEAQQGTSYYQMVQAQGEIADLIRQDPNVDALVSTVGGTAASTLGGPNYGEMVIHLKPRSERPLLVDQIIEELRPKLAGFPGMRVFLQNPPTIQIGGQVTKSLYQFSMHSPDKEELYPLSQKLLAEVMKLEGVRDVTSDLQIESPQVKVNIDRDKAAAMQVSPSQIENAFYDAFGPRWVSTIYAAVNEYKVLLELEPRYQMDPRAISLLYFKSANGQLIPLDTLASIHQETGPQAINHFGQLPAVTISFNLVPGVSLGGVVSKIDELAQQTLPATIGTTFEGEAKAFQSSLGNLWVLLLVAVMVVYIVLGILYESYIHPLTILSGLPSAGFGALITLYLFRIDLNIYAFVGLIMLIGIVKKNAIMQIDFALDAERNHGMSPLEAIYQGCLIRFRPIMMTTMAALLGALPIALGYGAGAEARRPLGLAVVGGLLFSQLITLYLTPVFYTYLANCQVRFQAWRTRRQQLAAVAR
ncbi:MAG TPA: efflux RND transporter permease subunit [Bryobacteraceae bacterium]|nr:efflux RND transporter permease subunit [Bryobacteraceae bacterium]